jgi:hypothetical protein
MQRGAKLQIGAFPEFGGDLLRTCRWIFNKSNYANVRSASATDDRSATLLATGTHLQNEQIPSTTDFPLGDIGKSTDGRAQL